MGGKNPVDFGRTTSMRFRRRERGCLVGGEKKGAAKKAIQPYLARVRGTRNCEAVCFRGQRGCKGNFFLTTGSGEGSKSRKKTNSEKSARPSGNADALLTGRKRKPERMGGGKSSYRMNYRLFCAGPRPSGIELQGEGKNRRDPISRNRRRRLNLLD